MFCLNVLVVAKPALFRSYPKRDVLFFSERCVQQANLFSFHQHTITPAHIYTALQHVYTVLQHVYTSLQHIYKALQHIYTALQR